MEALAEGHLKSTNTYSKYSTCHLVACGGTQSPKAPKYLFKLLHMPLSCMWRYQLSKGSINQLCRLLITLKKLMSLSMNNQRTRGTCIAWETKNSKSAKNGKLRFSKLIFSVSWIILTLFHMKCGEEQLQSKKYFCKKLPRLQSKSNWAWSNNLFHLYSPAWAHYARPWENYLLSKCAIRSSR